MRRSGRSALSLGLAGYAFSGMLGLAAVIALGLNLRATDLAPIDADGG